MKKYSSHYQIYACLPFVELAQAASIEIGPVRFWPASTYSHYLEEEYHETFQAYMESIGQIKAQSGTKKIKWMNTTKLNLACTTCLSISNHVPLNQREAVLIDSLYLLYFACTFRDLYYSNEMPPFNAFQKIIPCSLDFIQVRQNWENLYINEAYREHPVCIHLVDQAICQGLGKTLAAIYEENSSSLDPAIVQVYKRLVRSIRYLVDRFFQRFMNLIEKGLHFSEALFEPEDVIFLASSFEALFDINDKQVTADFKHKLRPLLHLKFSKPLEIFWKWVDDFYDVRRQIVQGGLTPDPLFRINPNFEIPHLLIGIKLFIYSVYYTLYRYHLLHSTHDDPYTPPDFKWIHPEEILLFFWTEESLLNKLKVYIKQAEEESKREEVYADIHLLTSLFVSMYERYYSKPQNGEIRFIPTPLKDIQTTGKQLLDLLDRTTDCARLITTIAPRFKQCLKKRLRET